MSATTATSPSRCSAPSWQSCWAGSGSWPRSGLPAKLDHPHILTLIDSGESDGLWYAIPYVRGESLRHKLERERQVGVNEALAIARQIAGALDHAHRHGIIHRDVKPENTPTLTRPR